MKVLSPFDAIGTVNSELGYDPNMLKPGIVHIGWGKFASAFIGHISHDLAAAGHHNLGLAVIGPSDRLARHFQAMSTRDYLYYILRRNGEEICTPIGAVRNALTGHNNQTNVIERLAHDDTQIVTVTVEKNGYCLDDKLQIDEAALTPDIKALRSGNWSSIKTVPGWITAALYQRYQSNKPPFIVMSCDNFIANGDILAALVKYVADQMGNPHFADYVRDCVLFPNTMVDRVTPIQDFRAQSEYLRRTYNKHDLMPVVCEEHRELAIEDIDGRLPPHIREAFTQVGVEITPNIERLQDRKLRIFNGGHSLIGVMGTLLRVEFVDEMLENQDFNFLLNRKLRQTATALEAKGVEGCHAYVDKTLRRYGNILMRDQVSRLIASMTSKIDPRHFDAPAVQQGLPADASAFSVAATLYFLRGRDESDNSFYLHPEDNGALERHGLADHNAADFQGNLVRFLSAKQEMTRWPNDGQALRGFVVNVHGCLEDIATNGLRSALNAAAAIARLNPT